MKVLVDASVMVYLAEVSSDIFSKTKMHSIEEALQEVRYIVKDHVALDEIARQVEVVKTVRSKIAGEDKALSTVDCLVVQTAVDGNFVLVSDDKKLLGVAKGNGCRVLTTPRYVESLVGKDIELAEAKEMLEKLRENYVRRKVVDVVLRRLEKWR